MDTETQTRTRTQIRWLVLHCCTWSFLPSPLHCKQLVYRCYKPAALSCRLHRFDATNSVCHHSVLNMKRRHKCIRRGVNPPLLCFLVSVASWESDTSWMWNVGETSQERAKNPGGSWGLAEMLASHQEDHGKGRDATQQVMQSVSSHLKVTWTSHKPAVWSMTLNPGNIGGGGITQQLKSNYPLVYSIDNIFVRFF